MFVNHTLVQALLYNATSFGERLFDEDKTPVAVQVQFGMQCRLTRNINKDAGLVNGAKCVVLNITEHGIRVETNTGCVVIRHFYQNGRKFLPLARAYASTLAKMQGTTLEHITIMPDVIRVPAAGYVAVSRVRSLSDCWFLVRPDRVFFVPSGVDL